MAGPNRTGPGRTALGARSAAPRSPPRRAPRCRTAAPRPGDPLPAPPRLLSPAQGRRSHPPTLRGSPLDALPSGVSPLCLSPDAGSPGPAVARRGDGRGTPRPPPASRSSPEGGSLSSVRGAALHGDPPLRGDKKRMAAREGTRPLGPGHGGTKSTGVSGVGAQQGWEKAQRRTEVGRTRTEGWTRDLMPRCLLAAGGQPAAPLPFGDVVAQSRVAHISHERARSQRRPTRALPGRRWHWPGMLAGRVPHPHPPIRPSPKHVSISPSRRL